MTTVALKKKYESIGNLTQKLGMPFEHTSAKALKKFICLSTDKKSVKNAAKLFETLVKIKSELLSNEHQLTPTQSGTHRDFINDNLLKVNSLFKFVSAIFALDGNGAVVTIDEPIMLDFLAAMEKCQALLEYISNYLQLAIETLELNSAALTAYTPEESYRAINELA